MALVTTLKIGELIMHGKLKTTTRALALAGVMAVASAALADGGARGGGMKDSPAPAAFSWTGFYGGLHIGAVTGRDFVTDVDAYNSTRGRIWSNSDQNSPDLMIGGQLGYNHQVGALVVGLEGDLGWMGLDRSTQDPVIAALGRPFNDSSATWSTGIYGTITGRLGIALADPKLLIYAKAGWGFVDSKVSFVDSFVAGLTLVSGTSRSEVLDGWVYGGGIEWAFDRKWSVKAEYLHFDLGSVNLSTVANSGTTYNFKHDMSVDTFKVGINYRF